MLWFDFSILTFPLQENGRKPNCLICFSSGVLYSDQYFMLEAPGFIRFDESLDLVGGVLFCRTNVELEVFYLHHR